MPSDDRNTCRRCGEVSFAWGAHERLCYRCDPPAKPAKTCICGSTNVDFRRYCGCDVCRDCDHHQGLARCFCGWSMYGGDGRAELIEMGENLDEDY
jgi:hypothetical protein